MPELSEIPKNKLDALLRKYLVDHSSRRFNFLYWNVGDQRDQCLSFVNLTGKDLKRINNSDLVYRLVKVKNQNDWEILSQIINTYIVDENIKKAVYVIRLDYFFQYLKAIGYDFSQFSLSRELFGTGYCFSDDPTKRKPICTIDDDIQSIYLLNSLYSTYKKFINQVDNESAIVSDILKEYQNDNDFLFKIIDGKMHVNMPISEALDIVARKFVINHENPRHEQIYLSNGLSTVMSRFICTDMIILSVRVYIQLFLKKYTKGK